jgi:hypothetical protein
MEMGLWLVKWFKATELEWLSNLGMNQNLFGEPTKLQNACPTQQDIGSETW